MSKQKRKKQAPPPFTIDRPGFEQAGRLLFVDIERELQLARVPEEQHAALRALGVEHVGGGNLLAALGLLCYTEFAGKLMFGHVRKDGRDKASANFNSFFDELGAEYAALRAKHDIYDLFRCGLAHEYYIKETCTVFMFAKEQGIGIRERPDGTFAFVVEDYCRDLKAAFPKVEAALIKRGVIT
ncbi:MAG: hypothetical protein QM756_16445 [Polyangiaceae bacterium]